MIATYRLKPSLRTLACAIAVAVTAPAALAQSMQHGAGGGSHMDMNAMMKENCGKMMSMPMSGNPDVDFAMMMRVHHQGAIEMAEMELQSGKEPEMRKMAQKIIAAQKREIAELDKFLQKHGKAPRK